MAEVGVMLPVSKSEIATTHFFASSTTLWILAVLFIVAGIVLVAVLYVPNEKNVVLTKGIPSSLMLSSQQNDAIVPEKMPVAVHENLKAYSNELALAKEVPHASKQVQIVENAKHVQDIAPFEDLVSTNPLLKREKPLVTRSRVSLEDVQVLADKMGLSVENYLEMYPLHENVKQDSVGPRKTSQVSNVDKMMAFSNTNNLNEVASLVRDINQAIPTSNDALATEVLRDILRAQEEAASLNLVLPHREAGQTDTLKMYLVTKKQPMADLAKSILSRAAH